MLKLDLAQVSKEQKRRLWCIVAKFDKNCEGYHAEINKTSCCINTEPGALPVTQPPLWTGPKAREFLAKGIERLCKANIIEPGPAECASPVVSVPNHDGLYCMCSDYRKHNSVPICNTSPHPQKNGFIDSLGDVMVF